MARELQNINSSGELTEIKLGGTADGDKVLTSDEVDAKDTTVLSTATTYTDDAIDAINESWGVITALDQEPDASMKVGDYMTTAVTGTLTNFDSIVVTTGQTVVKNGETTWAIFSSSYDYNYFTVPYSGARTNVDLGVYDISAANLTPLTYGVFSYLIGGAAATTLTTAGTFYPIAGTFINNPSIGFAAVADPAIQYTGTQQVWFKIDWHCSFKNDTANSTISVGLGDADGSTYPESVMKIFAKNAGEVYTFSGTAALELITGDKIQLIISSNNSGEVVTVENFTTTIKTFII